MEKEVKKGGGGVSKWGGRKYSDSPSEGEKKKKIMMKQ